MLFDFGVSVAVTIALVEVIKKFTEVPEKFQPAIALIAGVVVTFLGTKLDYVSVELVRGILANGLLVGLTASGVYDQKNLVTK